MIHSVPGKDPIHPGIERNAKPDGGRADFESPEPWNGVHRTIILKRIQRLASHRVGRDQTLGVIELRRFDIIIVNMAPSRATVFPEKSLIAIGVMAVWAYSAPTCNRLPDKKSGPHPKDAAP